MSKLRSVNTRFWDDNYVIDLEPVEKLLFLYLLTNTNTNMLGIYELHARKIAFDTGIDKQMVIKIFERFERDGRATLCQGFVILHNHLKHQNFNSNMGISAITTFNELPESIKNKALESGVVDLLKQICKPLLKGSEPIIKGLEPFGKVEYEYELESELESETESESAGAGEKTSFTERLESSTSKQELFDLWFEYRKSKGRHPNLHEKDLLLNKEWKNKSIEQIRQAIVYTVTNGWFSIQYPEHGSETSGEQPLPQYLTTRLG